MKTKETLTPNMLNNFLSENTKYLINETKPSIGNIDEISDDDEIWIVQCPKGIDSQQLNEHKIKLPGKTNCNLIETFAEEFTTSKEICVGFKSKQHFKIKQFALKGGIIIRDKLKLVKTEKESNEDNISSVRVPFPANLKIRHPLHGSEFKERINLDDDIRERLLKSDEIIKKKNKLKKSTEEYSNSDHLSSKKRKHKGDETVPKKTVLKIDNDEDISMDLAWIKNI